MSADAIYLPMADLSDGHALNVDFHAMADTVSARLRRRMSDVVVPADAVERQAGLMKQIWNDMVDDMMAVGLSLIHI